MTNWKRQSLCFFYLDPIQSDAIVTSRCMHYNFCRGREFKLYDKSVLPVTKKERKKKGKWTIGPYSDKLAHLQVVINCQYSFAQMCTSKDSPTHYLGTPYFDDVMRYNKLITVLFCLSCRCKKSTCILLTPLPPPDLEYKNVPNPETANLFRSIKLFSSDGSWRLLPLSCSS